MLDKTGPGYLHHIMTKIPSYRELAEVLFQKDDIIRTRPMRVHRSNSDAKPNQQSDYEIANWKNQRDDLLQSMKALAVKLHQAEELLREATVGLEEELGRQDALEWKLEWKLEKERERKVQERMSEMILYET